MDERDNDDKLSHYFAALERLKNGECINVPVGTKISNDAVSLEAGRKVGSIKKSRAQHHQLIQKIDQYAAEQAKIDDSLELQLVQFKEQIRQLRDKLDESMGRELSLLLHVFELNKKIHNFSGDKVVPLRKYNKERES